MRDSNASDLLRKAPIAILVLVSLATPALAQVTFSKIATTASGSGFSSFAGSPTISSNGDIAFTSSLTGGGWQIFTALPGGAATATQATTVGGLFSALGPADVNNSGLVAFTGTTSAGTGTYLVSPLGPVSTISTTISGALAINSAGTVAIGRGTGVQNSTSEVIYKSTGGGSPVVVDNETTDHPTINGYFDYLSQPAIDGNSSVYYAGSGEGDLYAGVYRDGAQPTSAGNEYGNYQTNQFTSVAVNSLGTLAFYAPKQFYHLDSDASTEIYRNSGLYIGSNGDPVAYLSGYSGYSDPMLNLFQSFGAIAINDEDQVAFYGTYENGQTGIFANEAGGAPNPKEIIGVGYGLDGSTVTSLSFARDGLADMSSAMDDDTPLVFEATLANGVSGIYTASVEKNVFIPSATAPEPETLWLELLGIVLSAFAAGRYRRRALAHCYYTRDCSHLETVGVVLNRFRCS